MTLSEWIISISGATIAIVLAVATYFAEKWIGSVDTTLKELTGDFKGLTKQVSSLEQSQKYQAENITQTIQSQLSNVKIYGKIDSIEEEVSLVRNVVQGKILPFLDKHASDMGRVILLEQNSIAHNEKLISMFNVVKVLAEKKQQDQTPAQASKSAKAKA
jgi:hypothetical protein